MGRWLANLFWSVRRRLGPRRPSDAQLLGQRLDGIAARLMVLEAEQRRIREEGWRVAPARVIPLRSVSADDN